MRNRVLKFFLCIFFLVCCSLANSQSFISIKQFGVDGIERKNEPESSKYERWAAIKKAFQYCIKNKVNLFFPSGVYDVGVRNFPFRISDDVKSDELLDANNIMVFGEQGTVFMTNSIAGADVLQLNKIKNITFKNIAITALLNGSEAGSNGISITNGFDNILLENIYIYNLPGIDYGTYIDGGKGLTIQFQKNSKAYKGSLTAKNIKVVNSAYGFRMDAVYLTDIFMPRDNVKLDIDISVEKAYQGFSIEFGEADRNFDFQKKLNIKAKAMLKDCQQYVRMARVIGGEFDFQVSKNAGFQNKIWNKKDSNKFALLAYYIKNADVKMVGNVGDVDYKFWIGAVGSIYEPFNLKNRTENSVFYLDVLGNASKADFKIIEFNNHSIENSKFVISEKTLKKKKVDNINKSNQIIIK